MALAPQAIDTLQRLVDQVQALSSVAETLTLRLLDLEERILVQERAVREDRSHDLGALSERRLADTEARLQGLEQMLASSDSVESAPESSADASPASGAPAGKANVVALASGTGEDRPECPDSSETLGLDGTIPAPVALEDDEEGWDQDDNWSEETLISA